MNGLQIENTLEQIDRNIESNMEIVREEVLSYIKNNSDDLAKQIYEKGYGIIPTRIRDVTISRDDLLANGKA